MRKSFEENNGKPSEYKVSYEIAYPKTWFSMM